MPRDTIRIRGARQNNLRDLDIDLPLLLRLGSGILCFDAVALLAFLTLRAKERSAAYTVFKLLNILINVGCNVLFLIVLDYGVEGIFWANLVASASTFLMLLPIVLKNITFSFSKETFQELLAFGLPYLPSTLSVVIMDTIDRVFVAGRCVLKDGELTEVDKFEIAKEAHDSACAIATRIRLA